MTSLLSPALIALCTALFAVTASAREQGHTGRPQGVSLAPLLELKNQHGQKLARANLRGRPFLVIFGYTSCPEVCPTSLFDASQLLDELGPAGERLGILFVTVDPERDTVEQLRTYMDSFHPRIIGLTGSPEQVATVAAAFGAPIEKNRSSGDSYSMSHSSQIFFMDKYGMLARPVPYNDSAAIGALSRRLLAQ
jgi:protein SCO1